jgi:DNA polymerase/3'-5' exonuclease PolX
MSLFNITLKNIKNKKIIDEFVKYYEYIYYNQDSFDNTPKEIYYKLLNVKRVIGILSNYKNEITMDELEKLKNVKFIGDKSILRIKEILLKGFLSEIIQLKEKQKSIDELTKIYSISAKKANELYKKGIKTIDDLKKYDKITDQQKISLKYYDKLTDKIPKAVMKKFDTYLQKTLHKYDPNLIGVLCGSYRRGKDFSSDMDILITHSDLKNKKDCKKYADIVVMLLKNYLLDILTVGYNNHIQAYATFDKLFVRCDIIVVPIDSFYTALMHFTGNYDFNMNMRKIAKDKNMKLNEYHLTKNNKNLKITSEKDIFNYLDMEYIPPNKR